MHKNEPVKITIDDENNARKITCELNWDCGMPTILESFYGMLIAGGYSPSGILTSMEEFVDEKRVIEKAYENSAYVARMEESKDNEDC